MADLLPPNATQLDRVLAAVGARIGELPVPLRDLMNPDTCPVALLPWLASTLAVSPWNDSWTETQKRGVIGSAYLVHRQRGTLAALKRALDALGVSAEVVEWWQTAPEGKPYTFQVDVETYEGMDTNYLQSINSQIDAVKPVRSSYTVRLIARPSTRVVLGMVFTHASVTTIYPKVK
ncbi:phage tail protein I [Massilia sp. YIM B02763]|uniref:phage tail protein I n=1 Tax=Massilia sp. YIM B02763 TaxID=3050130 RepID=UPI0025B70376|nr:phage tail protein I [Massilia sp. YIM B02763]MDN4056341.1 phage tail protein I [Massilia sp. YIM B02763]